jgi:hypothetical protein
MHLLDSNVSGDTSISSGEFDQDDLSPHVPIEARIFRWLSRFGFAYNPFEFSHSERDPRLHQYYIAHPVFDECLESSNRLVFASFGAGKTALRLQLEWYFRDRFASERIFAFSYVPPDTLIKTPSQSFNPHLKYLLRDSVQSAFLLLAYHGRSLPELKQQHILSRLVYFFDKYYPTRFPGWRSDLQEAATENSFRPLLIALGLLHEVRDSRLPAEAIPVEFDQIGSTWLADWLARLQRATAEPPPEGTSSELQLWQAWYTLLHDMGIKQVMILGDGFDGRTNENRLPADNSASAALPIINAVHRNVLGKDVSYRLFLPLECKYVLRQALNHLGISNKSIANSHLIWSDVQLAALLTSRLRYGSNDSISHLAELCDEGAADIDVDLVAQARSSPRTLIHAVEQVIKSHLESAVTLDDAARLDKITLRTLTKVTRERERQARHMCYNA